MTDDKSPRLVCPACQGRVQRVSRSVLDRFMGLLVSTRRYQCLRTNCGWHGLMQGRVQRHGEYRSHRAL